MDTDLRSIQQARELIRDARAAQEKFRSAPQEKVDQIVSKMAAAGAKAAESLARRACTETGFGRIDSKIQKNLFATTTLLQRMEGMRTCGVIDRKDNNSIWEVAVPMGVVAALVPSTNPTSTAMYKAIIAAKARCGIVMSPHPRAVQCTAEALEVVAQAAYRAGAPKGLFGCMTEVSLAGTNELLENKGTDVILATGGTPMVRAAYSKGKPAYGVGSGNVPAYVDRSADVAKAAADIVYGVSFDWGTLCSTERSVVADMPIRARLVEEMKKQGSYFLSAAEADLLEKYVAPSGRLNVKQVGKPPFEIAAAAGIVVPKETRALVVSLTEVGKHEPLSMETLSPILSFYTEDGWEAGCERCIQILNFGGIGHTLALHCTTPRVIEAFALEKPAMRIVVNTVAALGSVGYTTNLFPAMTLGPGTVGGSITSDNISPLHLINIKRVAFEVSPITMPLAHSRGVDSGRSKATSSLPKPATTPKKWIDTIEQRLRDKAGSVPPSDRQLAGKASKRRKDNSGVSASSAETSANPTLDSIERSGHANTVPSKSQSAISAPTEHKLADSEIQRLIDQYRK